MAAAYLLVLSEQKALAWILEQERMAFSRDATQQYASRLRAGDCLFLYTTTRTFHNPVRDKGRIIGRASVASKVTPFSKPVRIADREFVAGCRLKIESLAAVREGVELAPLVPRLDAFPKATGWQFRLWSTLVPLSAADAKLVDSKLQALTQPPSEVIPGYLALANRGLKPYWPGR